MRTERELKRIAQKRIEKKYEMKIPQKDIGIRNVIEEDGEIQIEAGWIWHKGNCECYTDWL